MAQPLLEVQNTDGGWGFRPGTNSWTEPTTWALLSLHGAKDGAVAVNRGIAWLQSAQSSAGSWHAAPGIDTPSWIAGLVCLLPPELIGQDAHRRGLAAVREAAEKLPTWSDRLRNWMLGIKPGKEPISRGWAWVPGTAAWLVPTAISILALKKYGTGAEEDNQLLQHAESYLLRRQCQDGGWNHGASKALGYEAPSYPETTGLALLALRGSVSKSTSRGLDAAARLARNCQTLEGAYWLRLALHAHGRNQIFEPPVSHVPDIRQRAIQLLVERSIAGEGLLWRS